MMETPKKISIAGSSKCENSMNNQTETAWKIPHKKHMELPKNETTKILPFSLLGFLSFPSKYETVKLIINPFDIHTNKTAMNETPKNISNFIVLDIVNKTALAC